MRYFITIIFLWAFFSCGKDGGEEGTAALHSFLEESTSPTKSCVGDLCLEINEQEQNENNYLTPILKFSGVAETRGSVGLFKDSECSTPASNRESVNSGGTLITANQLVKMKTSLWAQYEDPNNQLSTCIGPVVVEREESISLGLVKTRLEGDLTPTFSIFSNFNEKGTAQLFSDSACTIVASDLVTLPNSVMANELPEHGKYKFWVKVVYDNGKVNNCFGETLYNTKEKLTFSFVDQNYKGTTPRFYVGGLTQGGSSGNIQLFSDSACTVAASGTVNTSSGSYYSDGWYSGRFRIRANPIDSYGGHDYYLKHVDAHGNTSSCLGTLSYEYELFNNLRTPGGNVRMSGILSSKGGTIQLFSDSACTATASGTAAVNSGTQEIVPNPNFNICGSFKIYAKHKYENGESGCYGFSKNNCIPSVIKHKPAVYCAIDPTPSFQISGMNGSGTIQLFSDSTCTAAASGSATVDSSSDIITANTLGNGVYNFYVKYTDGGGNNSCFGGVGYKKGCVPILALSGSSHRKSDTRINNGFLNFETSGFSESGTAQVFIDSTCTTSAKGSYPKRIRSGALFSYDQRKLADGVYTFYIKYTDDNGNSICTGGVKYKKGGLPNIVISGPSQSCSIDPTPSFQVSGMNSNGGTIQLFSDRSCTTSISSAATVDSSSDTITAKHIYSRAAYFYVKYTDRDGYNSCHGSIRYNKCPSLAIIRESPSESCDSDTTPTFKVTGLTGSGTIQLFSDRSCSTAVSSAETVDSTSDTITSNAIQRSGEFYNKFYVKHTDIGDHSVCSTSYNSYGVGTITPRSYTFSPYGYACKKYWTKVYSTCRGGTYNTCLSQKPF